MESFSTSNQKLRSLNEAVELLEISMIKNALTETNGHKQKASNLLGITRQGLFKKMKRYGL
jgi:transcriptional regulator with PAS, ATPase and Fis domain